MLSSDEVVQFKKLYAEHRLDIDYKLKFGSDFEKNLCQMICDVVNGVHPSVPRKLRR